MAPANVAKKLCVVPDQTNSLEAFLASRLIPLDKNSRLRPIGVGEVIRRIIGKSVVHTWKKDIIRSVGNLEICAGHESGCEAAIHAMSQIFNEEDSEAVLLIDAFNAFNAVNCKLFLHNVSVICPEIVVFVILYHRDSCAYVLMNLNHVREQLKEILPQWRYMQLL